MSPAITPQVGAKILEAGVTDCHGDGLALEVALQELDGGGYVGSRGVARENAFLAGEASRDDGDVLVLDREVTIDVVVVEEWQLLGVTAALYDVSAATDALAG